MSVVFVSLYKQMPGEYFQLGHDSFLPLQSGKIQQVKLAAPKIRQRSPTDP
jgi:hypothetical protein